MIGELSANVFCIGGYSLQISQIVLHKQSMKNAKKWEFI